MKTIISLLLFLSLCMLAYGDDIIVLNNGDIIRAKVLEIGKSEIKYKKTSNPKGPTYDISSSDVLSITYENGEKESFSNQNLNNGVSNSLSTQPAPDNKELLDIYSNTNIQFKDEKRKNEEAKSAILVYKLTENSILSNNDLSIKLEAGVQKQDAWYPINSEKIKNAPATAVRLKISITNKTENVLYIDLKQSYRNGNLIGYRSYYDNPATISQGGNSSTIGATIGFLGVAGTSTTSNAAVKQFPDILQINPHETCVMPAQQVLCDDKEVRGLYELLSNILQWYTPISDLKGLKEYGTVSFTEEESPFSINFHIIYSTSKFFENTKQVDFCLYGAKALGLPPIFGHWWGEARDKLKILININENSIIGSVNLEEVSPTSPKGNIYKKYYNWISTRPGAIF